MSGVGPFDDDDGTVTALPVKTNFKFLEVKDTDTILTMRSAAIAYAIQYLEHAKGYQLVYPDTVMTIVDKMYDFMITGNINTTGSTNAG